MRITIFAAVVAVVLTGGSLFAHHSYADFFVDQTASVEGEIEELLFVNPHVILKIRAQDSNLYIATWQAAYQLGRTNVISTTLKVGDRVIVAAGLDARFPIKPTTE